MTLGATAFAIVRGTPPWVFPLAAYLVWSGVRSMRPRVTSVGRVLTTPTVFIVWGVVSFVAHATSARALVWVATAAVGIALGVLTVRLRDLRVDRTRRLIWMPGSVQPLVRNLGVFAAKYALGVAAAFHPDARDQIAVWDVAVSGISAGYFVGWVLRFRSAHRAAPTADLTPAGPSPELIETAR